MQLEHALDMYHAALSSQDLERLASRTTEDVVLVTPMGELPKAAFLATMQALFAGFPDFSFDHGPARVAGDRITIEMRMAGTHTGLLALPIPGIAPIAPTGKRVTLPHQNFTYTIRDGLVSRIDPEPVAGGGVPGILEQLGGSAG
jgi:predicted ester cyclase